MKNDVHSRKQQLDIKLNCSETTAQTKTTAGIFSETVINPYLFCKKKW